MSLPNHSAVGVLGDSTWVRKRVPLIDKQNQIGGGHYCPPPKPKCPARGTSHSNGSPFEKFNPHHNQPRELLRRITHEVSLAQIQTAKSDSMRPPVSRVTPTMRRIHFGMSNRGKPVVTGRDRNDRIQLRTKRFASLASCVRSEVGSVTHQSIPALEPSLS